MGSEGLTWANIIRATWDAAIEQGKAVPVATFVLAWFQSLQNQCREIDKEDLIALSLQTKSLRTDKIEKALAGISFETESQRDEIERLTQAFVDHLAEKQTMPETLTQLAGAMGRVESIALQTLSISHGTAGAVNRIEGRMADMNPMATCHAEIDGACTYLVKRQPDTVLALLEKLKREKWDRLSDREKYRIEANIGHAHRQKGDSGEAARQFMKAASHQPDDESALCLKIEAHALLGEEEPARALAAELYERNPESAEVAACWIATSGDDTPFESIENNVSKHLRNVFNVAFALAQRAIKLGLLPTGEVYARLAAKAKPEEPFALHVLAEIIIETERRSFRDNVAYEGRPSARLTEAISYITQALDLLGENGAPSWLAWLRMLRGVALELAGQDKKAEEDLTAAYGLNQKDPNIRVNYALLEANKGNLDKAIDTIREMPPDGRSMKADAVLATFLGQRNKPKDHADAIALLERKRHGWAQQDAEEQEWCLTALVKLYVAEKRYDEAITLLSEVEDLGLPKDIILSHRAAIQFESGEVEDAGATARTALKTLGRETDHASIVRLAFVFYQIDEHREAVDLFKRVVSPGEVTQRTLRLLDSARKCGDDKFVLAFCKDLRNAGIFDLHCVEFELATLETYNAFTDAVAVANDVINRCDDPRCQRYARVRRSRLGIRLGKPELIETNPKLLPEVTEFDANMGRLVAQVLMRGPKPLQGVQYAYELYRAYPDDFEACSAVAESLLPSSKAEIADISPETASIGSAVTYRDQATGKEHVCIIEDLPNPKHTLQEYAPDHPLAAALIGKRGGEEFEIPNAHRAGRIMQIVDKYVYRWRHCFAEMTVKYPQETWIWAFDVREDPKLTHMISVMESHNKVVESALKHYREHHLPVASLAQALGKPVFQTVEILGEVADLPIRYCLGNAEEIRTTREALGREAALVLDVTALATIFVLDLYSMVLSSPREMIISQGTYEQLREGAQGWGGKAEGEVGLVTDGDRKHLTTWQVQDPEQRELRLKTFTELLDQNCQVISGTALAEIDVAVRKQLVDLFGRPTAESMALAVQRGAVLWADDVTVQAIGRELLGLKSTWIQAVLDDLFRAGVIKKRECFDATYALLQSGYKHTVIPEEVIRDAIRRSEWSPDQEPLRVVLDQFANGETVPEGLFMLAAVTLRWLWREALLEQQSTAITIRILDRLASRTKGLEIISALEEKIEAIFGVDIINAHQARNVIRGWMCGGGKIILP